MIVLSYVEKKIIKNDLSYYNLITVDYLWIPSEKRFKPIRENVGTSKIIFTGSRKKVTLKELVNSSSELGAINRVFQESILKLHTNPSMIVSEVLTLPKLTFDSDIQVFPSFLTINIENELFEFETINIDYSEIYPFINSHLFDYKYIPERKREKDKKYVTLTFDDGPNTTSTVHLLEMLQKEEILRTFFLLGKMVDSNPRIAQSISEQGHEIANHSYYHPDFTTISLAQVKEEVLKTDEAIFKATGVLPKSFRPPYGAVNEDIIKNSSTYLYNGM